MSLYTLAGFLGRAHPDPPKPQACWHIPPYPLFSVFPGSLRLPLATSTPVYQHQLSPCTFWKVLPCLSAENTFPEVSVASICQMMSFSPELPWGPALPLSKHSTDQTACLLEWGPQESLGQACLFTSPVPRQASGSPVRLRRGVLSGCMFISALTFPFIWLSSAPRVSGNTS